MTADRDGIDLVGPVLRTGPDTDGLIAAIRTENPDVRVIDRGSYQRVLVPQRCSVSRPAIEAALHRPFRLPGDLEALMVSFRGRLQVGDDAVSWHVPEARP